MQRWVSLYNAQRISIDRKKVPFRERNGLAAYNCGLRKPATTRGRAPFPHGGSPATGTADSFALVTCLATLSDVFHELSWPGTFYISVTPENLR
jgi:hypothetical protein